MNDENMEMPDVKALVAFGKLGFSLMASRLMSVIALFGVLALGGFTIYIGSWQGVAVTAIIAWFVFRLALKAESRPEK